RIEQLDEFQISPVRSGSWVIHDLRNGQACSAARRAQRLNACRESPNDRVCHRREITELHSRRGIGRVAAHNDTEANSVGERVGCATNLSPNLSIETPIAREHSPNTL